MAKSTLNSHWHVEHQIFPSGDENTVSLLVFEFSEGANVSEGEEHVVLSVMADRLRELGLPSHVPLSISLDDSAIRIVVRDSNATVCFSLNLYPSSLTGHNSLCC